jgi:methylmalonyl-CoA mutase N-terminal domain/subunit
VEKKDKEKEKRKAVIRDVTLESGIPVKTAYTPDDVKNLDYARDIGMPGEFPFTRGIHPHMYRTQLYTMRQYAGFGTPEETNRRFRTLIDQGQTALNVAFDLPTQNGLDSDDPRAEGEVGRVGMAVDTLADFEEAFRGIDLGKVSTALTINAVASVMIAMHEITAEKQSVAPENIRGTVQNDILKEYIGRGAWVFPVEPSIRLIGDTIEYCAGRLPRYSPVSVCGYHIRESGATPAQEMACAVLIAKAYARHVMERGLEVDAFAPLISFNFDIHGSLFEQVAKFRAGRRIYARMMKEELGAKNPRSMQIRMIAGGGGGGLTRQQPLNNIIRSTIYALASALSGTQTMALCCYDEAYTIPSEQASLIGLRTMQIVGEESGAADTVDPLGGSWYVESLTDEMEKKILEAMKEIESAGGIVRAVSDGFIQRKIAAQAYREELAVKRGEIVKVGVNKYVVEEESLPVEIYKHDEGTRLRQIEKLRKVKGERDSDRVRRCLSVLKEKAAAKENLMPFIKDAVRVYATVGEITAVFKEVFGEFKEPKI